MHRLDRMGHGHYHNVVDVAAKGIKINKRGQNANRKI
jgi:hypothetical protein